MTPTPDAPAAVAPLPTGSGVSSKDDDENSSAPAGNSGDSGGKGDAASANSKDGKSATVVETQKLCGGGDGNQPAAGNQTVESATGGGSTETQKEEQEGGGITEGKPEKGGRTLADLFSKDEVQESTTDTNSNGQKSRKPKFQEHESPKQIAEGIASGRLFTGKFRVNQRDRSEGYFTVKGLPKEVLIKGSFQNRAIAYDVVAVKVLPVSYWWKTRKNPADEEGGNAEAETQHDGNRSSGYSPVPSQSPLVKQMRKHIGMALRNGRDKNGKPRLPVYWQRASSPREALELLGMVLSAFPDLRPTGQVVGIVNGSTRRQAVVGVLSYNRRGLLLLPVDPLLPGKFRVFEDSLNQHRERLVSEAKTQNLEKRTLVRVRVTRWDISDDLPLGMLDDVLGPTGDIDIETKVILDGQSIKDEPFPEEVLKCLPSTPWSIPEEERETRWDLRSKCIFSIDPPTAKDLDDALSIEPLENGNFKVGVHIADVSHFVKPNNALDAEARNRTTSVYIVQRVIPMLPHLLCQELCSLNPGVERLAFSVIWELTGEGEIVSQEINKSIICSCAKLGYPDAQAVIKNGDMEPPTISGGHTWQGVKDCILNLHSIAQKLRAKRHANGALKLNIPKLSFELDELGMPLSTAPYVTAEANHLIEEFMLLANMSVAKFLVDAFPDHSLLRRHPSPDSRMMSEVASVVKDMGVEMDVSSALGVSRCLKHLQKEVKDPAVMDTIVNMVTKPMQLAEYYCTGKVPQKKWWHYGLAVDMYTHFTSPIRRYPDLIVHRQLEAALKYGKGFSSNLTKTNSDELERVANECNAGKLGARNAQDASSKLYLMILLDNKPSFATAVVAAVKGNMFFDIYIPDFALTHRFMCADLPGIVSASFERGTLTIVQVEESSAFDEKVPKDASQSLDSLGTAPTGDVEDFDPSQIDVSGEEMPMPMGFPIMITQFQRVPVRVSCQRCVVFGRLMDFTINLVLG
ncbi:hypothetical protein BSKO_07986 [Bryopsis sp. KO-2023]|nr:hypothetical protein BSKO_07986 [Bryopsis sp. KO-2023]